MTGIMAAFHVLQDRRRPTDQPAPGELADVAAMTTGLPRASLLENARFALTYALPSLLRGALIPQPFWTELATRLNTGQWAVATVERLSGRHGGRSLLLRGVLGETLLILTTEDVRRVLDSPVEVFSLDAREKQRALEPFAPDALNASPPSLHVQRRPFNEAVLDYGHEPHRLAERFLAIVGQEITAMLATAERPGLRAIARRLPSDQPPLRARRRGGR